MRVVRLAQARSVDNLQAAFALGGWRASPADPKPYRVGLIGTGWYGKSDLWRLVQVAPVEIVSICDPDKHLLAGAVEIAPSNAPVDASSGEPLRAGRYACIEVTDTGCGIAPDRIVLSPGPGRPEDAGITLDDGQRRLLRGTAAVHLSTKAFELLQLLVARRPEAVSKRQIQDRLWPETFVSEGNLATIRRTSQCAGARAFTRSQ